MQAQDTLLYENFDDSTLGQFMAFSEVGNGEIWMASDFDDRFFAQINGFNGGIQDNIDWLISPALDMSIFGDETLTFDNSNNFNGPDLEVLVSEDYDGSGDPTTATWTDITEGVIFSPGGFEFVSSGPVDLSMVNGTAYIAFRYTSNLDVEGKWYQVDDILITSNGASSTTDLEITNVVTKPYVSNENLLFSVLESGQEITVSITSMNGTMTRIAHQQVFGNVSLPLIDLPTGAYVLVIQSEGRIGSFKFVK